MPELRKLTPAEVEMLERKPTSQRRRIEEQYDAFLSDYAVGEYGEAALEPGEKRLTIRNRLRAAAVRRGVGIDFKRTSADLLRFRVTESTASTPGPMTAPAASMSVPGATKSKNRETAAGKKRGPDRGTPVSVTTAGASQPSVKRTRRARSTQAASTQSADTAPEPKKRRGRPKQTA
jgi:hypothetical protein